MWFLHDGTGQALYCLAHGELAWHFQNHIQGWRNDLNVLISCFREKMPFLILLDRRASFQIICPLIPERYKSDSGVGAGGRGPACTPQGQPPGAHPRMRLQSGLLPRGADFNANRRLVPRDSWEDRIQFVIFGRFLHFSPRDYVFEQLRGPPWLPKGCDRRI